MVHMLQWTKNYYRNPTILKYKNISKETYLLFTSLHVIYYDSDSICVFDMMCKYLKKHLRFLRLIKLFSSNQYELIYAEHPFIIYWKMPKQMLETRADCHFSELYSIYVWLNGTKSKFADTDIHIMSYLDSHLHPSVCNISLKILSFLSKSLRKH